MTLSFRRNGKQKKGARRKAGVKKAAAYLLAAAMVLGSISRGATAAAQSTVQGVAAQADSTPQGQAEETVATGDGWQIILRQQNAWENGCQAEIEVRNTGREDLKNWSIRMELEEGTISHAWNVTDRKHGNAWDMESQAHNRIIAPGTSTVFGCQLGGASRVKAKTLELLQKDRTTRDKKEYAVTYRIVNEWETYAQIEAEIKNQSGQDIVDWQLSFEFCGEVADIWNAEVLSHETSHYLLGNKDYNAVIPAGGSVKIGFVADYGREAGRQPEGEELTSVWDERTEPTGAPTRPATEKPAEQTDKPGPTKQPETDTPSEEDFDPEEDIWVYCDIENRDWNMEMIHADSSAMEKEREKERGAVRVALLDSGVNYSDEVYVSQRKNFVPGEDDYSELYEDVSGHGTAVAEILASNPNGEKVPVDVSMEEDGNEYIYYDEEGNEQKPEEDEETEPLQTEGTLLELLRSGYEWNEGVNPGVDLISAKILDENNETTVERVVEAIDWAIENEADILNMSFGMEEDSEKLHKAVRKAYDAGILLIAAAGNDEKVEYPAAYPEVVAVGSVDSLAEQAGQSAEGKEVEVAAPGEFILSRGAFDSMQLFSGTSMAVPHVTGLASVLWEKDTAKPADFIRQLIVASARPCGKQEECGYGLIDCEFALDNYEKFAESYTGKQPEMADGGEPVVQMDNTEAVETDEDVRSLYGRWEGDEHKRFVSGNWEKITGGNTKNREKAKKLNVYLGILTKAVTFVDDDILNPKCQGMHAHPWFHGYYGKRKFEGKPTAVSNYAASYYYLYHLAGQMYRSGEFSFVNTDTNVFLDKDNVPLKAACEGIRDALKDGDKIGSQTWEQINAACKKAPDGSIPKKERSLVLFGMALHTLTDTYAHSSYGIHKRRVPTKKGSKKKRVKLYWDAVTHDESNKKEEHADNKEYIVKRNSDAKAVADRLMSKIKVKKGAFAGFAPEKTALDVYLGQKKSPVLKRLRNPKVKDATNLGKEYGLKSASTYVRQVKELAGDGLEKTDEVLKKMEVVDNEEVQARLKKTKVILGLPEKKEAGKKNLRSVSASQKETYDVYDMDTGDRLMTIRSDGTPYMLAVDEGCRCRVTIRRAGGTKRLCYFVSGGRVYDAASGEIPETFLEDAGEEPEQTAEEEEDEEERGVMQDVFSFEYGWYDSVYRAELTWKDKSVDLDLLMMAMFPYEDEFYLTCIRDKTSHPELGDVFESDLDRASLDRDVTDASGAETISLHNIEEGGLYLFLVRNFHEKTREQLAESGAILRMYRKNETEPFYTGEVPAGDGYYWNAFYLWGDTGEILPIDTITDEAME